MNTFLAPQKLSFPANIMRKSSRSPKLDQLFDTRFWLPFSMHNTCSVNIEKYGIS